MSTKSTLFGILEAILQTEERNKHSLEIIERIQINISLKHKIAKKRQ